MVLSQLPDANVLASGLMTTDQTKSVWPARLATLLPFEMSHNLMEPSLPPEANILLSGLKAAEATKPGSLWSVARSFFVTTSHNLIVPSSLAEARILPSGLNTTDSTKLVCPTKLNVFLPVAT